MHHALIFSIFLVEYPIENNNPSSRVSLFGKDGTGWRGQMTRSAGSHKIASHLRDTGDWDVEVIDFWNAFSLDDLKQLVDSRIHKDTVFVGFSYLFGSGFSKQERLVDYIRQKYPQVATVAGGISFQCIRSARADYYVMGRGEYGIEALGKHLTNSGSDVKIKDVYQEEGHFRVIDCREDYPAEPKTKVKVIYEDRDFIQPNETLAIELSRGCRFRCAFCDYYPLGVKGDYTRDADDFESEMRENYDRWGVTNYLLTDETINDRTEKLEKFGAVVKDLSFNPRFHGYVRSDLIIHRGQREIDALLDLGVTGHWYGVESLNHKSAASVGKGMASDKVKEGLLDLDKIFTVNMSFILGLPHESMESMRNTMEWIWKHFQHRQVQMYPLEIKDNRIDTKSKLELSSNYGWDVTDVLGRRQWIHPTEGYTMNDMENLAREFYKRQYDRGPTIWSLPWITALDLDPDVVYNDRIRPQGEYFPASCQQKWDDMLERYRIKKLSL